ncbi:hypothetical protein, partial [Xanthovirga aplysinae]|uniref:hypothetical protein n=1 Tax=Xanthovirga aplysinae TaxID=2529853 RepID=UPI001657312E
TLGVVVIFAIIVSIYYLGINYLVFKTRVGYPFDEKHLTEVQLTKSKAIPLNITYEYPLVNFSGCKLMIYGQTISDSKLLYSGDYKSKIMLKDLEDNMILSFRLIKDNKVYIYGSKGKGVSAAHAKRGYKATLFLSHSEKYNGHYKIEVIN